MLRQMNNILLRNIRYDYVCGFKYNLKKYIIAVIYVILGCVLFLALSDNCPTVDDSFKRTFMDFLIYFFAGDKAADFSEGTIGIPAVLLGMQILIASAVGYYAVDDIYGYGKQVFIRVQKKTTWWLSKCVWAASTVLLVYIIVYGMILLFCVVTGQDISMSYHPEIVEYMNQQYIGFVSGTDMLLHIFVTPVMYSIMISFAQITLSMLIGPLVSFLAIMVYDIMGILLAQNVLLINYSMLVRNKMVSGVNIEPMDGVVYMLIISVICIVIGAFVIKRKEIFEK